VTVEAASPALVERTRHDVSDAAVDPDARFVKFSLRFDF
jgi:hypothetical protein